MRRKLAQNARALIEESYDIKKNVEKIRSIFINSSNVELETDKEVNL